MGGTKTLVTAAELETMSFPDERVELAQGELIRMPPAGLEHSYYGAGLVGDLRNFVKKHKLGIVVGPDAGFTLDENTVRSPDVSFITRARIEKVGMSRGFWPGAPDLAVEVFSPTDSKRDLFKKIQEYFRAGTRLVWVLFSDIHQVYVYRSPKEIRVLEESDTLTGDDLIPGFSIRVSDIFS